MSCSRETCFSAFSCRRAPTKSRLMSFVLLSDRRRSRKPSPPKKNVGVTHVPRRPTTFGRVYTRPSRASNGGTLRRSSGRQRRARAVAPLHVRLEQLDELVDQAFTAERPVEPAVDEHGRDR